MTRTDKSPALILRPSFPDILIIYQGIFVSLICSLVPLLFLTISYFYFTRGYSPNLFPGLIKFCQFLIDPNYSLELWGLLGTFFMILTTGIYLWLVPKMKVAVAEDKTEYRFYSDRLELYTGKESKVVTGMPPLLIPYTAITGFQIRRRFPQQFLNLGDLMISVSFLKNKVLLENIMEPEKAILNIRSLIRLP